MILPHSLYLSLGFFFSSLRNCLMCCWNSSPNGNSSSPPISVYSGIQCDNTKCIYTLTNIFELIDVCFIMFPVKIHSSSSIKSVIHRQSQLFAGILSITSSFILCNFSNLQLFLRLYDSFSVLQI